VTRKLEIVMRSPKQLIKTIAFRYLPSLSAPHYQYGLDPIQLAFLVDAISERASTKGCIVEIGVARGMTTCFLAEHLVRQGIQKHYHAIDTFASFTSEDIDYEVVKRKKTASALEAFSYNNYEIWKRNFEQYRFVTAHQGDCKDFDFGSIEPISVALLDVDLYLPTSKTLPKVYDALEPGGIILVDDVRPANTWDGAFQAYTEFCQSRGLTHEVIGSRGGVIRKPS